MTTVKEQILAKLNEIDELLQNAKVEGMALDNSECEDVVTELYSAYDTFEETVLYYVD